MPTKLKTKLYPSFSQNTLKQLWVNTSCLLAWKNENSKWFGVKVISRVFGANSTRTYRLISFYFDLAFSFVCARLVSTTQSVFLFFLNISFQFSSFFNKFQKGLLNHFSFWTAHALFFCVHLQFYLFVSALFLFSLRPLNSSSFFISTVGNFLFQFAINFN